MPNVSSLPSPTPADGAGKDVADDDPALGRAAVADLEAVVEVVEAKPGCQDAPGDLRARALADGADALLGWSMSLPTSDASISPTWSRHTGSGSHATRPCRFPPASAQRVLGGTPNRCWSGGSAKLHRVGPEAHIVVGRRRSSEQGLKRVWRGSAGRSWWRGHDQVAPGARYPQSVGCHERGWYADRRSAVTSTVTTATWCRPAGRASAGDEHRQVCARRRAVSTRGR